MGEASEPIDDSRKRKSDTSETDTTKRRRVDGERDTIRNALLPVYTAVVEAEDETGRPHSELFIEIPKRSEYPDYHVLIKRPVCLKQIKRRIDTRAYKSLEAARADFHQMFENARTYNQEGSLVWLDAEALQRVFDSKYPEAEAALSQGGEPKKERGQESTAEDNRGGDGDDVEHEEVYGDDDNDSDGDEYAESEEEEEEVPAAPKKGMKVKLSVGGRRKVRSA